MPTITITDDSGSSRVLDWEKLVSRHRLPMPNGKTVHQILMDELDAVPAGEERSRLAQEWEDETVEMLIWRYLGACIKCDRALMNNALKHWEEDDEMYCAECYPGQ